jgi:hypothetical protein
VALPASFIKEIVERANENMRLIDDTTDSVKRIMDAADLVYAIWQDPTKPLGVGIRVVKGLPILGEIITTGKTETVRWQAIPCNDEAQAIALQQVLGDRLN